MKSRFVKIVPIAREGDNMCGDKMYKTEVKTRRSDLSLTSTIRMILDLMNK